MPRSPEHNERIRRARREEIFRAAGRVFAKKGFAATKIADIAVEAGLSHGLLYHYFPSKEAVYVALLDEMIRHRPSRASLVGDARTGMERLERTVGAWLQHVTERPELAVVVAQAFLAQTLPPRARRAFLRFVRDGYRDLVADIAAAQREGEAVTGIPPDELAVALASLVRGLAIVRMAYAAITPAPAVPSLDTVLRVVRAEGDATAARPPRERSEVGLRSGAGRGDRRAGRGGGGRRAAGA